MTFHFAVPDYYQEIVEIIRTNNWLLHNFQPTTNIDVFNAANYQHNRQLEGIEYKVILDVNFLQYLLNVVKKSEPTEHSKIAAAYLTFFQISDIQLDPAYAIYEKINYSGDRAEEAIFNLELFNGINNHSCHELALYALGCKQQLHIHSIASEKREELKSKLLQYKSLTDWDSLYLSILAITKISIDKSISRSEKMVAFTDWCIKEFRLSLAAMVYATGLFGKKAVRRMMKYKINESPDKNKSALSNMTWDLYYVDRYMKSWASKDNGTETLLLTADRSLKLTMQLAVECQLAGNMDPFQPYLGNAFEKVKLVYSNRNSTTRKYKSKGWSSEYHKCLINQYESELLKTNL